MFNKKRREYLSQQKYFFKNDTLLVCGNLPEWMKKNKIINIVNGNGDMSHKIKLTKLFKLKKKLLVFLAQTLMLMSRVGKKVKKNPRFLSIDRFLNDLRL